MDTTDPDIVFDESGRCNHCIAYDRMLLRWGPMGSPVELERLISRIKQDGKGRDYDIVLGLSGGVDSSYLALLASQWGLRTLIIHVDTGWNSELSVKNIENIVTRLKFDLETFVVDWDEMQDLQHAFLMSGVPNQDIPQDHAIFAAFYRFAHKHRIRWSFSGTNLSCESIMPPAWGHDALDLVHLKAIHARYGRRPLRHFPLTSHLQIKLKYQLLGGLKIARPLNLIEYSKGTAVSALESQLGWRNYEVKHFESRFTKFFQGWYLPKRWGFDKRLAHFSSLIVSGQMSRDDALNELERGVLSDKQIAEEIDFVRRKLDLSAPEMDALLQVPKNTHAAFKQTSQLQRNFGQWAVSRFRRILTGGTG